MNRLKKLIKKVYHKLLRHEFAKYINPININSIRIGTDYGGWVVCPDLLNDKSIVYSFGIGEDISFDTGLIKQFGCSVFAFDPTPKSIQWIAENKPQSNFVFYDYGLSQESGFATFHLPKNKEYVSGSLVYNSNLLNDTITVPMKRFKDIIADLQHKRIDILKMDIEGTEYDVLQDILNADVKIKQICIEFHHRKFKNGKRRTKDAIILLRNYGFECFSHSESYEELSFVKMS
jgi:FkbM family methyltransferase